MNKRAVVIASVVILAVVAAVVIFTRPAAPVTPAVSTTTPAAPVTSAQAPAITLSAEAVAALAKSHGFQYLVSYTNRGFEPASFTVKKGETVRWTNNSSGDMWIASVAMPGGTVYPGQSDCGSNLDTCMALKPGDFWEFTFDAVGTWSYKNNSDTGKIGTITVK